MAKKKPSGPYKKHNWRIIKDAYVMRKDMPSLRKMAGEFNADHSQLSKKAKREGWDKRRKAYWDKVSTKVQQKSTEIVVTDRVKAIKDTQGLIEKVLNAIGEEKYEEDDKLSGLVNSFDKLLRLHELLSGQPDSRPGEGITFEEFIRELRKRRTKEHKEIQVIEAEATIKELGEPEKGGK